MRRRLIAWIALFAMLAGLAVPAHAYAHLRAAKGMAADFCTSKSAPAAPATSHATACDACANCMPSGTSAAGRAQPVPAAGYVAAVVAPAPDATARPPAHFEARAPPPLH